MIDRQFNRVIVECDSCDELFTGDTGETFEAVWHAAKEEGWRCRKIANEWLHGCPKCGTPT